MEIGVVRAFAEALVLLAVLDSIWLGVIVKDIHKRFLHSFTIKKLPYASMLIAYILFSLGIALFVTPMITSIKTAVGFGALFGLIISGFYNFTNYSIFADYPEKFLFLELLWGVIASGIITTAVYMIG